MITMRTSVPMPIYMGYSFGVWGAEPGNGTITRDAVLAAALQITDRDGTGALSIRRLARALNRDPMILCRHAPNKAALLNGVAETVLAQLHVDSAAPRQLARTDRPGSGASGGDTLAQGCHHSPFGVKMPFAHSLEAAGRSAIDASAKIMPTL